MNILLIHQNFPGQFLHLARHLTTMPGVSVLSIGRDYAQGVPGVPLARYHLHRDVSPYAHRYLRPLEAGILHGQAVLRVLMDLKSKGYKPDVAIAHAGWGEALFLKDVFPDCKYVGFFEFFYHTEGADVGFDPEDRVGMDDRARLRCKNALHMMNLAAADIGVAPTQWQRSVHPPIWQEKIRVIHEGIDTSAARPMPNASFRLSSGRVLTHKDKVVTYIGRNLEPYRGFPQIMRAAERLCKLRKDVDILIVGGDEISYGKGPADAANWREKMMRECLIDTERVHFVGRIPYAQYLELLAISSAHVYLTYPFVLSWSMMEAMSTGCVVIASDTSPVREVIKHGENGLLVDFFDTQQLVDMILSVLDQPERYLPLRTAARETIARNYSVEQGVAGYLELIKELQR